MRFEQTAIHCRMITYEMLHACKEKTRGLKSPEAKAFNKQIGELSGIMDSVGGILDKASKSGPSKMLTALLKRLP